MAQTSKTPLIVLSAAGLGVLAWWLIGGKKSSTAPRAAAPPAGSAAAEVDPYDTDALAERVLADGSIEASTKPAGMVSRWLPTIAPYALVNLPKRMPIPADDFARLIAAHIWTESRGREDALGDAGNSYGLMQIHTPAHPKFAAFPEEVRFDPDANIGYGSELLATLLDYYWNKTNDPYSALRAAVSAYNAGQGNVNKAIGAGRDPASVTYKGAYTDEVLENFYAWGGTTGSGVEA